MQTLRQDLRFGARMLLKQRGFTLIAWLTLTLGIGANAAIFSIVNAVLLRPLPYPESERLVMAYLSNPQGQKRANLGMADFLAVRERNQSFEKVAMFTFGQFAFTGGEQPEQISGAWVSADFFATLGVAPAQGRAYQAEDERPENARMVVISDGFWRQRLAADSQVIGKTITLNSTPHTVIGVARKGFSGVNALLAPDVWLPLGMFSNYAQSLGDNQTQLDLGSTRNFTLNLMARLAPGITAENLKARLDALEKGAAPVAASASKKTASPGRPKKSAKTA